MFSEYYSLTMSCSYKEVEKNQNFLHENKTKDISTLTSLVSILERSSQQLKNKWSKQLLYKLYIIHNRFNTAHCNVCIDSLKVDENNNLVLINSSGNKGCNKISMNGCDRFKAPEVIEKSRISKAGDIWATGICIYYIINSTFPWKTATKSDKNFCLWADKGVLPKSVNNPYTRVLRRMLCIDYKVRPSIKRVIRVTMDAGKDKNAISKLNLLIKLFKIYLIIFYR